MKYASFGRRAVAKLIDHTVLMVLTTPMITIMEDKCTIAGAFLISLYMFPIAYSSGFLARFQATPGKMLLGLKVVNSDGGRLSEMQAFGRSCAELISSLLLYIGYLIAVSDDRSRTLHDRLAATAVVRK